jgi:hypothetical protein
MENAGMNTSDLQVYDYVTDAGRRVSISLGTFGEIEKRRTVDASITVDGVERLHTSGHVSCPEGVKLGEWTVYCLLNCLSTHMAKYNMFQMLNNLLSMANADDLQLVPVDDRHIAELTDQQAEWWNDEANIELIEYIHDRVIPS